MVIEGISFPNAQENLSNITFGLTAGDLKPGLVKSNLEVLMQNLESANNDPARLGISIDQLKTTMDAVAQKNRELGQDFPAAEMNMLAEKIKQIESNETKKQGDRATSKEDLITPAIVARDGIINLINSAKSAEELRQASQQIENFDDKYAVSAPQGSPEKQWAIDTYNYLSKLLNFKRNDLSSLDQVKNRIKSL